MDEFLGFRDVTLKVGNVFLKLIVDQRVNMIGRIAFENFFFQAAALQGYNLGFFLVNFSYSIFKAEYLFFYLSLELIFGISFFITRQKIVDFSSLEFIQHYNTTHLPIFIFLILCFFDGQRSAVIF